MSENKLVKTFLEAATLTSLAASIGWIAKKAVKENFTSDPSSNAMNYVKFTVVMAAAIALTQYLEDQKILPDEGIVYSMALVAILAGGAVINAFAFVGRNYLARFLSGYDPEASLEEKKDMTKLSRLTEPPTPNTKEKEGNSLTGLKRSTKSKSRPSRIIRTPTRPSNCTTRPTNRRNSTFPMNPRSLSSTNPVLCKNKV